jgi:hypothetical protein
MQPLDKLGNNGGRSRLEPGGGDQEQPEVIRGLSQLPRLARRDHECIGCRDLVQAAVVERCRPFQGEAEHQLSAVPAERHRLAVVGTKRADLGEATGRDPDFGLLRLAAVCRRPGSRGSDMAEETLPAEDPSGIAPVGKLELMVRVARVNGRSADLDHFEAGGAFENAVANLGRLDHQVPLAHHERLAGVLVDKANPPAPDVNDLQRDAMIVDPVGNRSAFGDRDV